MTTETKATTFADLLDQVGHYQALGMERVHIPREADDQPWELTTGVKEGSTHRLDMSTSLSFEYEHPSGVTFFWFLDVEDRDANGSGQYKIDVPLLAAVFARLPEQPREYVRSYLTESAAKVEARGHEYMDGARRQYGDAAALIQLARGFEDRE